MCECYNHVTRKLSFYYFFFIEYERCHKKKAQEREMFGEPDPIRVIRGSWLKWTGHNNEESHGENN